MHDTKIVPDKKGYPNNILRKRLKYIKNLHSVPINKILTSFNMHAFNSTVYVYL